MSTPSVKVTVTWMDGREASFLAQNVHVKDGLLYLTMDKYPRSDEPSRMIPLDNIRIWTAEE